MTSDYAAPVTTTDGYLDLATLADEHLADEGIDLAVRAYVRDPVGKFASEGKRDGETTATVVPNRDQKVPAGSLNTLGDVRAVMRTWRSVPMRNRAAVKARLLSRARALGGSPRLLALLSGLGDGDGTREAGEGSGAALRNGNARQWLRGQRQAGGRVVGMALSTTEGDVVDLADPDTVLALDMLDLAPGDYTPPYDWKHGFIPLTPAAVASKAGTGPNAGKGRASRPKGKTTPGKTSKSAPGRPKRVAGTPAKPSPAERKAADDAARGRGTPGASPFPTEADRRQASALVASMEGGDANAIARQIAKARADGKPTTEVDVQGVRRTVNTSPGAKAPATPDRETPRKALPPIQQPGKGKTPAEAFGKRDDSTSPLTADERTRYADDSDLETRLQGLIATGRLPEQRDRLKVEKARRTDAGTWSPDKAGPAVGDKPTALDARRQAKNNADPAKVSNPADKDPAFTRKRNEPTDAERAAAQEKADKATASTLRSMSDDSLERNISRYESGPGRDGDTVKALRAERDRRKAAGDYKPGDDTGKVRFAGGGTVRDMSDADLARLARSQQVTQAERSAAQAERARRAAAPTAKPTPAETSAARRALEKRNGGDPDMVTPQSVQALAQGLADRRAGTTKPSGLEGRSAASMTPDEKAKAAETMFGTDSPQAKKAGAPGRNGKTLREDLGGAKVSKATRDARQYVDGVDDPAQLYRMARGGGTRPSVKAAAREKLDRLGTEDLSKTDISVVNRRAREGDALAKAEQAFRSSPAGRRERDAANREGQAAYVRSQRENRDTKPIGDLSDEQLKTVRKQLSTHGGDNTPDGVRHRQVVRELERRGLPTGPFDNRTPEQRKAGATDAEKADAVDKSTTAAREGREAAEQRGAAKAEGITPTTVRGLSDSQLERALDRLAEAGDFDSPAFKAVEAEQNRRDDAREAARKAKAAAPSSGPTVTPEQRKTMVDKAVAGGQNRADAERLLDRTLREAGPGTIDSQLKYLGFGPLPKSGRAEGNRPRR